MEGLIFVDTEEGGQLVMNEPTIIHMIIMIIGISGRVDPVVNFRPCPPCIHTTIYTISRSCYNNSLRYPRWWGEPRDRAAMGLETTTPHRLLRGAIGASVLTTRRPDPPSI